MAKDKKAEVWTNNARTNLRIAVAIRNTNLSQVAVQAGLSRNALSQFLTGHTNLSYRNMLAICDVLDIPIGLLHLENAITPASLRNFQQILREISGQGKLKQ